MVTSFIIILLDLCRPFTVFRRIILFIINAFDGVRWRRSFAHICKKGLKRSAPSIAHGNTATPIIFKVFNIRIIATVFYTTPRLVFNASCFAMCFARTVQDTLAYRFSYRQVALCPNRQTVTMNALTIPLSSTLHDIPYGRLRSFDSQESGVGFSSNKLRTNYLTSKIDEFTIRCHVVYSLTVNDLMRLGEGLRLSSSYSHYSI